MQTWEAITSRRNVRSFADRPIPAAELDQILEAGRRSPSSQNWQPWDFIVVTDRGQLRELAKVWRGAGHVAGSAATIVVIGPAADNEFARAKLDLGWPASRPAARDRERDAVTDPRAMALADSLASPRSQAGPGSGHRPTTSGAWGATGWYGQAPASTRPAGSPARRPGMTADGP